MSNKTFGAIGNQTVIKRKIYDRKNPAKNGHIFLNDQISGYLNQCCEKETKTSQKFLDERFTLKACPNPVMAESKADKMAYLIKDDSNSSKEEEKIIHEVEEMAAKQHQVIASTRELDFLKRERDRLRRELTASGLAISNDTAHRNFALMQNYIEPEEEKYQHRRPRHLLTLAGFGFTSATTPEAMISVLRGRKL